MNFLLRFTLVCCGTLSGVATTTSITASAAVNADEPAHEALRQIRATYEQAVATGDLQPLRALFTADTSAVMTLGHEIKTFEELEQHWNYVRGLIGPGGTYTTKLNPQPSLIFGDIAVARGTSDDVVKTSEGREFRFNSTWSAVCRRIDGQWKVLRLHASMDPVTNVFATTFLQRAKIIYGGGGLAVGAIIGLLAGLLLKRRRAPA